MANQLPHTAETDSTLLDLKLTDAEIQALPVKLASSLAGRLRALGRYDESARVLDLTERQNGEALQFLEERARLAFAQGNTELAQNLLQERIRRAPSPTARIALARLFLESGDITRASAIAAELAKQHAELLTVAHLSADVARARGDFETARSHYLGVVDANSDNASALLHLSSIALDENDRESARHFLRRALVQLTDSNFSHQLRTAAGIAGTLGENADARALEQRAQEVDAVRSEELVKSIHDSLGSRPEPQIDTEPAIEAVPALQEPPVHDGLDADISPIAPHGNVEPSDPRVLSTLREMFGHRSLLDGQAEVINHVMAGENVLAVMPTGSGKSLTFQLPAMLTTGATLVISPLIALMKDQIESLPAAVQERTTLINSSLTSSEIRDRIEKLRAGRISLVYVAPERLRQHAFLDALRAAGVARLVVDEAHCISLWGHDFRPDYLAIPIALRELGNPPVLAVTATATQAMERQIAKALDREMTTVRLSVFRPNLFYEVMHVSSRDDRIAKVIEICRGEEDRPKQECGSGIVYVSSRKDSELIAALLRDKGVSALHYHAGMGREARSAHQDRFMRGQVRVIVATVAFGMGVDKKDVRFIVHFAAPRSLEAYAQESGRAGRDGLSAKCVFITAPSDKASLTQSIRRDQMDIDALRTIYSRLRKAATGKWAILDPASLTPPTMDDDADDQDSRIALGLLEQARLVHRHPDAPTSYSIHWQAESSHPTPHQDDAWQRVLDWLTATGAANTRTIRTAAACDATGLTPAELDRVLSNRTELVARENSRAACFELLPATGDTAKTMSSLLERARLDAKRRVDQVIAYTRAGTCRHAAIAAHLGERLPPCKTSCDACIAANEGRVVERAATTAPAPKRSQITSKDALIVLEAIRTLPYNMGKPGLVRLLSGSMESRGSANRSPSFGALKELPKSKTEQLIDKLIDKGFLFRDLNHEFKIITLTREGASATEADLAEFNTSTNRQSGKSEGESSDLKPADARLYDLLAEWRSQRATADAVPPYVVAHNSMLVNLAVSRPGTLAALAAVPGFGAARVEKYGRELLKVIADA